MRAGYVHRYGERSNLRMRGWRYYADCALSDDFGFFLTGDYNLGGITRLDPKQIIVGNLYFYFKTASIGHNHHALARFDQLTRFMCYLTDDPSDRTMNCV